MNLTHVYAADIVKAEKDDNGDLMVYGSAASPTMDIDQQVADPAWLKSAMPAWMTWGNIREQHSKVAAGVGVELTESGDSWQLKSAIIDPTTALKVEKKVLKGYSIGIKSPRVIKDAAAPGGRIVGGEIVEISLVDRPANPDCKVSIAEKAVGVLSLDFEPVDAPALLKAAEDDKVNCPTCDGDGKIKGNTTDCPDCDATGKVTPEKAKSLNKFAEPVVVEIPRSAWKNESLADGMERVTIPAEAWKAVLADLVKKDFTDAERKTMAAKGQALPGGGFPIASVQDLKNAIQAIGRAKDPGAAKAHIIKRAKALGESGLIPDTWKGVFADLEKANEDEWTHDPAALAQVRNGLATLMQAELDELMKGEQEIWDIQDLLCSLQTFLNWWCSESYEGEVPAPGASLTDEGDVDMNLLQMGVSPDVIKAASADDATDEAKNAYKDAVRTALGVDSKSLASELADEIKAVLPDAVKGLFEERDTALEERFARMESRQAPGGPVTTRSSAQGEKATQADNLRAEAERYRQLAKTVGREMAPVYTQKAAEADAKAASLAAA